MKIRKAILTGGGHATRLRPITSTTNKHLIPLANKQMIFHAIEKVVEAGVKEIFINVNPGETELQKHVGDGGHWDVKITFFEQTGGPQGIAHVVNEAKQFIGDEPFIFYLSDNIILGSIKDMVEEFNESKLDCMLALSKVPDPNRFGVPCFDANGKLIDVIEKPENPPNDFAVTGIYLYGPKLFFEIFKNINKSTRGEYEISDIHSYLLKHNYKVGHKEITGWWKDTGKPDDLLIANRLLLDEMDEEKFTNHGITDPSAQISGKVHIGIGSQIGKNVKIIGPVIIAENSVLVDCEIGPYVTIGGGAEIKNASIKNSIILNNAELNCFWDIKDSLIGHNVKIIDRTPREAHLRPKTFIVGDQTILEL
jgi:glucose-1-phosphate thymidylyltransferase